MFDWLRRRLDAPRFCPADGEPIVVEDVGAFDPDTGARRESWVWHCPKVTALGSRNDLTWVQSGDSLHVHGTGRPMWHEEALRDDQ